MKSNLSFKNQKNGVSKKKQENVNTKKYWRYGNTHLNKDLDVSYQSIKNYENKPSYQNQ